MFYVIYIFNAIFKIFPIARKTEFAFTEYWPLKRLHILILVSPFLYFISGWQLIYFMDSKCWVGRYKRDILIPFFFLKMWDKKFPWVRCSSVPGGKNKLFSSIKHGFGVVKSTWEQTDLAQIILTFLKPLAILHSLIFHKSSLFIKPNIRASSFCHFSRSFSYDRSHIM